MSDWRCTDCNCNPWMKKFHWIGNRIFCDKCFLKRKRSQQADSKSVLSACKMLPSDGKDNFEENLF